MQAFPPLLTMLFCPLVVESLPAAVIYTHLNETYDAFARPSDDERGFYTLPIDFNGDGKTEFVVTVEESHVGILHDLGNRVLILAGSPPNIGGSAASDLGGALIAGDSGNANFRWYEGGILPTYFVEDNPDLPLRLTSVGVFFTPGGSSGHTLGKDGYLGFGFTLDDGIHYGWLHLDASTAARDVNGFVLGVGGYIYGWAWETNPSMGIVAGSIPEPSSWILLAAGIISSALRRKR